MRKKELMKLLITFAITVIFIFGTVGVTMAEHQPAEFKTENRGNLQISVNPFNDHDQNDFHAVRRFRAAFELTVDKILMDVFGLRTENRSTEESLASGAFKNTFDMTGATSHEPAYIEFFIPHTSLNLKVGKQMHTMSADQGSHILDTFGYSVVASAPLTDIAGVNVAWVRTADEYIDRKDRIDLLYCVIPLTFEGFELNPYGAYAMIDSYYTGIENKNSSNVWYAGLNFSVDLFDPFVITGDFNWGEHTSNSTVDKGWKTRGWMAALAVEYSMELFTPILFAFYESGEYDSSFESKNTGIILPNIETRDLQGFSGFSFRGKRFYGDGLAGTSHLQPDAARSAAGKWGVGLHLSDITFIDQLSHALQLSYYKGAHHTDNRDFYIFTSQDSAWEVNFNTFYQIYENLAALLELGYTRKNLSYSDDGIAGEDIVDYDDWKAAAGVRFRF